jgi:hypothetical protein
MAFIRWRGSCAQLLTTVYTGKGSKQITLANLPYLNVTWETKRDVEEKYPDIKVDWVKIVRALAIGPPVLSANKTPNEHMDMAEVEEHLRTWAAEAENKVDSTRLYLAAEVLLSLRARLYHNNTQNQS